MKPPKGRDRGIEGESSCFTMEHNGDLRHIRSSSSRYGRHKELISRVPSSCFLSRHGHRRGLCGSARNWRCDVGPTSDQDEHNGTRHAGGCDPGCTGCYPRQQPGERYSKRSKGCVRRTLPISVALFRRSKFRVLRNA